MNHFPGHQQALVKDDIVITVLSFEKHSKFLFKKTFKKFDYDKSINLCKIQAPANLGDIWNGQFFATKPYPSWIQDKENKIWKAPVDYPIKEGKYFDWDESNIAWFEVEIDPHCGCKKNKDIINV